MKLVETDAEGPSAQEPVVTPPRPEKRRVSISLMLTISVLVATVVTIYTVFPARDGELIKVALTSYSAAPTWDLASPSDAELRAWLLAAIGRGAPLPAGQHALGARSMDILGTPTVVLQYQIDGRDVTYLIQRAQRSRRPSAERIRNGVRAVQWKEGNWLAVGVGPLDSASWLAATQKR
jgi:hypothetical protein